jgi:hypothetical protein
LFFFVSNAKYSQLECSSKSIPLPALGLTDAVRVCDTCHFKLTSKSGSNKNLLADKQSFGGGPSSVSADDDDALQKAIAASLELSSGGGRRDETPVKKHHVTFSPDVTSPGGDEGIYLA